MHMQVQRSESVARPLRRLNCGCGDFSLAGWTNLDATTHVNADMYAHVPPLPFASESLDEIYAGHMLEHLERDQATSFLDECYRCLVTHGTLGVVVPDTRAIMGRWLSGVHEYIECPPGQWFDVSDLDDVCTLVIYSTVQESPHRWSYDLFTLARAVTDAGFEVTGEIDRYRDPRLGTGRWYQCGVQAVKR